jgi:hypothetical protein
MTCPLPENVWLPFTTVSCVPAGTPVLLAPGLPVPGVAVPVGAGVVGVDVAVGVGVAVADFVGTGMGELLGDALADGEGDVGGGVDWLGEAELLGADDGECVPEPGPPPCAEVVCPVQHPLTTVSSDALARAMVHDRIDFFIG